MNLRRAKAKAMWESSSANTRRRMYIRSVILQPSSSSKRSETSSWATNSERSGAGKLSQALWHASKPKWTLTPSLRSRYACFRKKRLLFACKDSNSSIDRNVLGAHMLAPEFFKCKANNFLLPSSRQAGKHRSWITAGWFGSTSSTSTRWEGGPVARAR